VYTLILIIAQTSPLLTMELTTLTTENELGWQARSACLLYRLSTQDLHVYKCPQVPRQPSPPTSYLVYEPSIVWGAFVITDCSNSSQEITHANESISL